MTVRLTRLLSCLVLVGLLLGGCTAAALLDTKSVGIFRTERVNLAELNYAAADYLAGQTLSTMNKNMVIEVGMLQNSLMPELVSPFARLVPEQAATRFSQLGYIVMLDDIQTFEGERRPDPKQADVLLTGSYLEGRTDVQVNLRLVDLGSGQIIGAFDYPIPMNKDIAALLQAQPRIVR